MEKIKLEVCLLYTSVRELDKNIQILELTQGFAYAPLQREAIRKAMTENCLVLTLSLIHI